MWIRLPGGAVAGNGVQFGPMSPSAPNPTPRPDYGVDAPGVVRNLFLVSAAGLLLFVTAWSGFWSGVIAHVDLSHTGLWAGAGCGLMGLWMLYDSKIGKIRERDRLLDLVPWSGAESVLDLGC